MSPRPARSPAPRRPRLGVDVRSALGLVGTLTKLLSLAVLFPTALAIGYRETPVPYLAAGAIMAALGLGLERLGRRHAALGYREGFLVVSLTWLLAAVLASIPYLFSGDPQIDRPIDALFEGMSGFTTTGATVLTDFTALDHSMLMWRQFTQWLGGMGIIVLALAVLPRLRVGGRQLLESELPGPEIETMADRIRTAARRLWLLYVVLTAAEALILAVFGWTGIDGRMTTYDAVAHAFSTLPTGGFSPEPRSLEPFAPATQWVVILFMVLAGTNFALLLRLFMRRQARPLLRDEEARLYAIVLVSMSALVAAVLWKDGLLHGEAAIRNAAFQVVSMMTTTGYASVDFVGWPSLCLMVLIVVMLVGGCAGSTAGSVKVVRHLLIGKILRRELRQTLHPEAVLPLRLNGVVVDERALRAVSAFVLLYVGFFVVGAGVIALDAAFQGPAVSALDALAASASTLGNAGPGLGFAGPMGSYEPFSDISTGTMIMLMWLGRLEIVPIMLLVTRNYWRV